MNQPHPPPGGVILVRHGQTEWSHLGRHTSRTDLPLDPEGRRQAGLVREALTGRAFELVLTSPMRRARETCEISGITGLNGSVEVSNDLTEWAYGDYEGLTTAQIQDLKPGWNLWRDGCPGGETAPEVGERCDRIIARLRALGGQSAVFAHGHLLRVLAVRWVGLEAQGGGMFGLDTATLSRLRLDGERGVIQSWNCDPIRSNGLAPYDQA